MHDVSAGAVACKEDPTEISELGKPWIGARVNPLDGGPAVVIGGGEGVFGRKAVVDGDDKEAGEGREGGEVGVVGVGEGGFYAEGAAVEVEEDGEGEGGG